MSNHTIKLQFIDVFRVGSRKSNKYIVLFIYYLGLSLVIEKNIFKNGMD